MEIFNGVRPFEYFGHGSWSSTINYRSWSFHVELYGEFNDDLVQNILVVIFWSNIFQCDVMGNSNGVRPFEYFRLKIFLLRRDGKSHWIKSQYDLMEIFNGVRPFEYFGHGSWSSTINYRSWSFHVELYGEFNDDLVQNILVVNLGSNIFQCELMGNSNVIRPFEYFRLKIFFIEIDLYNIFIIKYIS